MNKYVVIFKNDSSPVIMIAENIGELVSWVVNISDVLSITLIEENCDGKN